jgi:hypothetical protein
VKIIENNKFAMRCSSTRITRLVVLRSQGLLLQLQLILPDSVNNMPIVSDDPLDPFIDSSLTVDRDLLFHELLYILHLFHPSNDGQTDYGVVNDVLSVASGHVYDNEVVGSDDDDRSAEEEEVQSVEMMGSANNQRIAFHYWRSAESGYTIQLIRKPWPLADRFRAIQVEDSTHDASFMPCPFKYQFYIHLP